jgi:hypothetical protein
VSYEIKKERFIMMNMLFNLVANYNRVIMEENSDNLKMFEIRPGVYSNVDPEMLMDYHVADFDLNR